MESWRKVWRDGVAPLASTEGLLALKKALEEDDPRLLQGATTKPPPLLCVQDWAMEGSCPLTYLGWQGDGLETVGEGEEFFARMAWEVDSRLGEPAAVRHFTNWVDDANRDDMRRELLAEVCRELAARSDNPNEVRP